MDINLRIKNWKKTLRRHSGLEDGFIEELEVHLRDQIEVLIDEGTSEEEAFNEAVNSLGDIAAINKDEKIVSGAFNSKILPSGLLGNFLKVSRRQFQKNGLLNSINLVGLTTAFSAIMFIMLYLHDELNFERHHPDAERIYRLGYEFTGENGVTEKRAYSSGMWIDMVKDEVPAIEETVRYLNISYGYVRNPYLNQSFYEEEVYWADPNFFNFFSFDFKQGQPESQLENINSFILTESMARLHFGEEDPIGKTLQFIRQENTVNLIVTGVIKDPPSQLSTSAPLYCSHRCCGWHLWECQSWMD